MAFVFLWDMHEWDHLASVLAAFDVCRPVRVSARRPGACLGAGSAPTAVPGTKGSGHSDLTSGA